MSIFDKDNPALSHMGDQVVAALDAYEGESMAIMLVAVRISDGATTMTSNMEEKDLNGLVAMLAETHAAGDYKIEEIDVKRSVN